MRDLIPILAALGPVAALGASIYAAQAMPRGLGRPWIALAASAAIAVPGVLKTDGSGEGSAENSLYVLVGVASVAVFAFALGWILHLRDRLRFVEMALDAALIVGAMLVFILGSSPAVRVWFEQPGLSGIEPVIGALATALAIGCTLLFAMVLLLVRGRAPSRTVAAGFAIAAAGLSLTIAPLALGFPACCQGPGSALIFVGGWAGVAVAGISAGRNRTPVFRSAGRDDANSGLRLVIAPAVALFMGLIVAQSAWHGRLAQVTAVAFGMLAILLAVRVTHLLFATRTLSADRAELHQSRVLIELSHALSATTDLQETLDLVTQWAVRLLDGRGATIELVGPDGVTMEFRSIRRLPEDLLRLRMPIHESFAGWVVLNGRPRMTDEPHADPYISEQMLRYIGNSPVAAAPLRYRDEALGALICVGRAPFTVTDLELLRALADQAAVAIQNARLFQQVHHLSMTDPLTGLPNRRQLERDLAREFAAAQRGRRLTVVMFDVNGFKPYNDRYGHLAGDEALRRFASALASETRAMNIAARYGGDEFTSVLADAGRAEAEIFVGRLRQRFPGPHATQQERELSFSAGIAEYVPGMNVPEQLIAAADVALYEEKMRRRSAARLPQSA